MSRSENLQQLVIGAHTLTRIAALETRNEAPAAQWRALTLLRDHGDLRLGELAMLSRVTQPGMTRLVAAMADAGLVTKTTDASDSRVALVSVTAAGREALAAWYVQLTAALTPHFADLDDQDWDAIGRTATILGRILAGTAARAEASR